MRKMLLFLTVALVLCSASAWAFDDGDFQQWSTVALSYKINDDWKLLAEEELRWGDDWGNFYYTHTELGIAYSGFADWLVLGVKYRQIFEEKGRDFHYENRPHFNLKLKKDVDGWGLSTRSRLEYRDKEEGNDGWRYRNKFTIKAPIKLTKYEIRPYVADEIFYDCDDGDLYRNRLYAGVGYKLTKYVGGALCYLWQTTENSAGAWVDYNVLGTKVKFDF